MTNHHSLYFARFHLLVFSLRFLDCICGFFLIFWNFSESITLLWSIKDLRVNLRLLIFPFSFSFLFCLFASFSFFFSLLLHNFQVVGGLLPFSLCLKRYEPDSGYFLASLNGISSSPSIRHPSFSFLWRCLLSSKTPFFFASSYFYSSWSWSFS